MLIEPHAYLIHISINHPRLLNHVYTVNPGCWHPTKESQPRLLARTQRDNESEPNGVTKDPLLWTEFSPDSAWTATPWSAGAVPATRGRRHVSKAAKNDI